MVLVSSKNTKDTHVTVSKMESTVIVPQSHSSCQVLYGSQSLYSTAHHSYLI